MELNVNARQLRYFDKDHIHSLIPQTQLGILAEFEYLIKQWQIQKGYTNPKGNAKGTEVNGNVKSVLSRAIQTDVRTLQSIGVNTFFQELTELAAPQGMLNDEQQELFTVINVEQESGHRVTNAEAKRKGQEIYLLEDIIPAALARIKNNYGRKKLLTEGDRRLLAGSIVNYFESINIRLVSTVMENLAEQITQHFPTESKKAWYDRHKSRVCGRLYIKFYNSHRTKKATTLAGKSNKTFTNDADDITGSSIMDEIVATDQDEGSKIVQSWLKSNKYEDFTEIVQMWKDTLDYRLKQLKQLSDLDGVKDVLENWPSYKLERGHELLSMDFEQMHPHSMAIFRSRWLVYQQAIVTLFEAEVKEFNCLQTLYQYQEHKHSLNEDSKFCILMYLLHAIAKPYRVFKTATGSVRYCISDSQHTVCRLIQHQSEMEDYQEPYPCIFVVGDKLLNIRECYVCFWHIRYRLSFVDCLTACMQLYVVFQLDDPLPSLHFWQFVRGYLFDIHKEKDRPYVIMENVIQYLVTAEKRNES